MHHSTVFAHYQLSQDDPPLSSVEEALPKCLWPDPLTHHPNPRRSRLIARALLAQAIHQVTEVDPADIRLATMPTGKPYAVNPPDISFSLSHHGPWSGVAISPAGSAIGVDVVSLEEGSADPTRHLSAMRPHFGNAEWKEVTRKGSVHAQLRYLSLLWAAKEAYVKATGEGLSIDLNRINAVVHDDGTMSIERDGIDLEGWSFTWSILSGPDPSSSCAIACAHHQSRSYPLSPVYVASEDLLQFTSSTME